MCILVGSTSKYVFFNPRICQVRVDERNTVLSSQFISGQAVAVRWSVGHEMTTHCHVSRSVEKGARYRHTQRIPGNCDPSNTNTNDSSTREYQPQVSPHNHQHKLTPVQPNPTTTIETMRTSVLVFLATCSSAAAFAPASVQPASSATQLHAETTGRREAMGAIAALGAGLLLPQASEALQNPALQTLKSRKPTKQASSSCVYRKLVPYPTGGDTRQRAEPLAVSFVFLAVVCQNFATYQYLRRRHLSHDISLFFLVHLDVLMSMYFNILFTIINGFRELQAFIPGKGLRNNEEFETLVSGLSNPASATFKGRTPTKGQFTPGKGLRNTEEADTLMAGLSNPASATFKGRKPTKGQFTPGKGLRNKEESLFAGLSNPASATFKGRTPTKGQFIPGKGLHNKEESLLAGLSNPASATFKGRTRTKGQFIPGKGLHNNEEFGELV